MILGLSTSAFTILHVAISLIGIATGLLALAEMLAGRFPRIVSAAFLISTIATSATGFLFHSKVIGPPHIVGAISLVVLAVALFAFYSRKLAGPWRVIYIAAAVLALYLNVFVAIVQAFGKIPALMALAPTQTELPFTLSQGATLLLFICLGALAVRRSRPATV